MRLLTSKTVANAKPGVANPLRPGAVCPNANPPRPGKPPATPPLYGAANGDAKPCIKGLLNTPGAPARIESTQQINQ